VIAGLYLAAGSSTRFGSDKLLHEVAGVPLYSLALSQAAASRLTELLVVVGQDADDLERDIARRFAEEAKIGVVRNENAVSGLMSSVKAGLRAVAEHRDRLFKSPDYGR